MRLPPPRSAEGAVVRRAQSGGGDRAPATRHPRVVLSSPPGELPDRMTCPHCLVPLADDARRCESCAAARPEAEARGSLLGRTLAGRYQLIRRLGRGGFGTVYEAKDIAGERRVAVKTLHPALAESPVTVERFRREALATS